jgi:putative colanic acid biosynthesis UDP-glucose lipid carrier transferase
LPEVQNEVVHGLISFAENNLIRFKILPDFRGFDNKKIKINFYDNVPVLTIRKEPLENISNRILKRLFDMLFSSLVILLIFPWVFPIIAILIKLSSKGPVFFKQLRSGRDNNAFYCYKFRSMRVNSLADELQAKKNDPRITRIGKVLRKTSLDEMPQFFNVLIGNMSVVGPRPHMLKHTEEYSKVVNNFMVRHFVKPGITGLAQVKGFRGETTDPFLMQKRVEHDVWYIENWSILLDIKVIVLTLWSITIGDENAT